MYRRVFLAVAAVWGLLALPLSAGPALAEKRVALVIGNGAYQSVAKHRKLGAIYHGLIVEGVG